MKDTKNKNKKMMLHAYDFGFEAEQTPIAWLTGSLDYPKRWDKQAVTRVKQEIRRTELVPPVIVSIRTWFPCSYTVLAGWLRVRAAVELGYEWIPTINLNVEDPDLRTKIRASLEKSPKLWDHDVLAEFMKVLLNEAFIAGDAPWLDYLKRTEKNRTLFKKGAQPPKDHDPSKLAY